MLMELKDETTGKAKIETKRLNDTLSGVGAQSKVKSHAKKTSEAPRLQDVSFYEGVLKNLLVDKKQWEITAYKTSNEMLYGLLQRCYAYYIDMCKPNDAGQSARDALTACIKKQSLIFKSNTHDLTKIVKCVFGADRRRVSAYSIALRLAYAEKIDPQRIVDFITKRGGVEEIRLGKSQNFHSVHDKIEKVTNAIKNIALANLKSKQISQSLDTQNVGKQIVLLATQGADGGLVINAIVTSAAALKTVLCAYYPMVKAISISSENTKSALFPQQRASHAVQAAATQFDA